MSRRKDQTGVRAILLIADAACQLDEKGDTIHYDNEALKEIYAKGGLDFKRQKSVSGDSRNGLCDAINNTPVDGKQIVKAYRIQEQSGIFIERLVDKTDILLDETKISKRADDGIGKIYYVDVGNYPREKTIQVIQDLKDKLLSQESVFG